MGAVAVNWVNPIFILALAYVAAFLQAAPDLFRPWLGAPVSLLPALMVYAGLNESILTIALLAVCGGLWVDSLSENPLGASVLPLLAIGAAIFSQRGVLLRESATAQWILGLAASALWPLGTLFVLLNLGRVPLLNWGWAGQWALAAIVGGALTPACFWFLGRLHAALDYPPAAPSSFRPNREIKRGRF